MPHISAVTAHQFITFGELLGDAAFDAAWAAGQAMTPEQAIELALEAA